MTDCYFPPSHNLLAPIPAADRLNITPSEIFERLKYTAEACRRSLRPDELADCEWIVARTKFVIARRVVWVALKFPIQNNRVVEPPLNASLEIIKTQLQNIHN